MTRDESRPRPHVTAGSSDGGRASTSSFIEKATAGTVQAPFREVEGLEGLTLGFRQAMLELGDGLGGVDTGGGLGNDFITLYWRERKVTIRGGELLHAWVKSWAPRDAARFPEECQRYEAAGPALDADQLDFWRKTIAGEAGYNGHPQAVLKLLAVSDEAGLRQLALAFPEAVAAFREVHG